MKNRSLGFSLIELSVFLALAGGATVIMWELISGSRELQQEVANVTLVNQADLALQGFIMAEYRLPCPDVDQDGREDCSGEQQEGGFPYVTLGMTDVNARQLQYGVLRSLGTVGRTEAESGDTANQVSLTQWSDSWWPTLAHIPMHQNTKGVALSVRSGDPLPDDFSFDHIEVPRTQEVPLGVVNQLDFCYKLRRAVVAADSKELAGMYVVDENLAVYSVSYDSSGSDTQRRTMSPGVLWNQLGCGEVMASAGQALPNVALAGTILYRAVFDMTEVQKIRTHSEAAGLEGGLGEFFAGIGGVLQYPALTLAVSADCLNSFAENMNPQDRAIFAIEQLQSEIGKCVRRSRASILLMLTETVRALNNVNIFISSAMTLDLQKKRESNLEWLTPQVRTFANELIRHSVYIDALGEPIKVNYSDE